MTGGQTVGLRVWTFGAARSGARIRIIRLRQSANAALRAAKTQQNQIFPARSDGEAVRSGAASGGSTDALDTCDMQRRDVGIDVVRFSLDDNPSATGDRDKIGMPDAEGAGGAPPPVATDV